MTSVSPARQHRPSCHEGKRIVLCDPDTGGRYQVTRLMERPGTSSMSPAYSKPCWSSRLHDNSRHHQQAFHLMPNDAPTEPIHPKRAVLCSRANADRVARQIIEATGLPVSIARTGDPVQPFRVKGIRACRPTGHGAQRRHSARHREGLHADFVRARRTDFWCRRWTDRNVSFESLVRACSRPSFIGQNACLSARGRTLQTVRKQKLRLGRLLLLSSRAVQQLRAHISHLHPFRRLPEAEVQ